MKKTFTLFLGLLLTMGWAWSQNTSWFAVMTEGTYKQTYNRSVDFPEDWILEKAAAGLMISDVAYGEGQWVVVMSASKVTEQHWFFSETFPTDDIQAEWDEGYALQEITYANGGWFVLMASGTSISEDAWATRASFAEIETFIRSKWNDSKEILSLSYGNGLWCAVLANGTGYSTQSYKKAATFPNEFINEYYAKGMRISEVAYGEGNWVIIMSKSASAPGEASFTEDEFPAETIKEKWDAGKRISTLQFNNQQAQKDLTNDYVALGNKALDAGQYDKAIDYFSKALATTPGDANLLNNRAWAKFMADQCKGALADAEQAVKADPQDAYLHTRGSIYYCLDRCTEAIQDFTKAISVAKTPDAQYYSDRAKAKVCTGNFEGGIADYDKAIQINPKGATAYNAEKAILKKKIAENVKPVITWDKPYDAYTTSAKGVFTVKACINSEADITGTELFVNGTAVSNEMKGLAVHDDCTQSLEQEVKLKPGKNTLQIKVSTAATSVSSTIQTIEYTAAVSGSYHALLIGENDYTDLGINDLTRPIDDAKRLRNVLVTNYTFNPADVVLMENPTKGQILEKLVYYQERLKESDHLLIFYSGHGELKDNIGYWLPSDSKLDNRLNWLSNSEISDYIKAFKSRHTFVIADACFSGSIFTGGYKDIQNFACEEMEKLPSRRALTSGAKSKVPNESVFLDYLVKKLNENTSTCLSAENLYLQIKEPVIYNSPNNQVPQFGVVPQSGDEGGNFIFKHK
jgi:tetratricopeptide (TPR) repeat protein